MKQIHALSRSLVVALAVVVITALITPPVFQFFLGYTLGVRVAISLLLVAPLGLALGMPFPLGLRLASAQATSIGAWPGASTASHRHRYRAGPDPGYDFRLPYGSAACRPVLRRRPSCGRPAVEGGDKDGAQAARTCVSEVPKRSAGLLMYRRQKGRLEVFLVHPGGPFSAKKIWEPGLSLKVSTWKESLLSKQEA